MAVLEFVQEDSIDICGRIHDLICWTRIAGYTPEHLAAILYGTQTSAFEYHFPNLCVLPQSDYPYFVTRMRERATHENHWWGGLTAEDEPVVEEVWRHVDTHGPLRSRTIGAALGHTTSGWGSRATRISRVCEKLWGQGKLSIVRRDNFERLFDRTERVLPHLAHWHQPDAALPEATEVARYLARKRLKAKRLFRLSTKDRATLGDAAFCRVQIEGVSRAWYCLAEDRAALERGPLENPSTDALLLAPLDPLIYDRDRTRDLFDFDYMWEVYTPVAKRRWGYYVLPILLGERLIGRADLKRDRKSGRLQVLSLLLEPGVDSASVAAPIARRLEAMALFLGLDGVDLVAGPPTICKTLAT